MRHVWVVFTLSSHAAEQYELVCMKSLNTGNHERLFGQSRRIAERASNRHPENVIMSIMVHIQEICFTTHGSESSIRKLAVHLPDFDGTFLSHKFATKHKDSYQAETVHSYYKVRVFGGQTWKVATRFTMEIAVKFQPQRAIAVALSNEQCTSSTCTPR